MPQNMLESWYYLLYIVVGGISIWKFVLPYIRRSPKLARFFLITPIPAETLRVIANPTRNKWSVGFHRDKPAVWLEAYFHITNISTQESRLTDVYISKAEMHGNYLLKPPGQEMYGGFEIIPPNQTWGCMVLIWLRDKKVKAGKNLRFDFSFIDKFGNRTKVKDVPFLDEQRKDLSQTH